MSCSFLLQGIFPTQGSNLCLLHCQADSLSLSHQGSPMEYYPAIKKNEILPFVTTWMDLESITLNKTSQTNTVWFRLYVEPKKQNKWTNITKQKQSYVYRIQTHGHQREGGESWGEEINGWGRVTGTNLKLQNKWVTVMKCTAWGIQSIKLCNIFLWQHIIARLTVLIILKSVEIPNHCDR